MVTNVKSKLQQLQSINNCNFYKEHNFNQQQNIDEILAALKWVPAKSERLVLYCYKKVWWKRDTGEREIIGKRTKGMMVWLTQLRCLPPVTGPHILMWVTETCHPHRKRVNISPDYTPLLHHPSSRCLQMPYFLFILFNCTTFFFSEKRSHTSTNPS